MNNTNTIQLDVIDVPCGTCGAKIGKPCVGIKTSHKARHTYRNTIVERCTGTDGDARWWRWRIRNAGVPRVNQPCGTHAAYKRHKKEGTAVCEPCNIAARKVWAQQRKKPVHIEPSVID